MIEEFHKKRDSNVYEGFTLGGKNHKMKRTNELNLKNTGVTLYDEWVEIIEEAAVRLNKRYLKKFGHLDKFNPLQVHGEGVYYPLWKIQDYKKNKGHYHAWHTEQNYSRDTSQRLMVSMFYLNDVNNFLKNYYKYNKCNLNLEVLDYFYFHYFLFLLCLSKYIDIRFWHA